MRVYADIVAPVAPGCHLVLERRLSFYVHISLVGDGMVMILRVCMQDGENADFIGLDVHKSLGRGS